MVYLRYYRVPIISSITKIPDVLRYPDNKIFKTQITSAHFISLQRLDNALFDTFIYLLRLNGFENKCQLFLLFQLLLLLQLLGIGILELARIYTAGLYLFFNLLYEFLLLGTLLVLYTESFVLRKEGESTSEENLTRKRVSIANK